MAHAGPELDPRPAAVTAKAALRRTILARRDALGPLDRARLSRAALDRIEVLDAFRRARIVVGFASFGSELDTRPFLDEVLASGRALVLPRVDREGRRLVLYRVASLETDLRPGTRTKSMSAGAARPQCAGSGSGIPQVPGRRSVARLATR